MKSIISGGSLRLGGHRLKPVVTAALTVLLAVSLFFNSQLCYAISVNGETIGTAKDKAEVAEIVFFVLFGRLHIYAYISA